MNAKEPTLKRTLTLLTALLLIPLAALPAADPSIRLADNHGHVGLSAPLRVKMTTPVVPKTKEAKLSAKQN